MQKLKYILRDFRRKLRDIPENIHNLIIWIPVIWNDEQWDYDYLYKILHKKLSLMENYFKEGNSSSVNAHKKEKQIKIARILCERLLYRDYLQGENVKGIAARKLLKAKEDADREYLFNHIKNKIETWWD